MYFPGDPLFDADPIFQSVRDPRRASGWSRRFDWETTTPEWALGYRFDIVLGGRDRDPIEEADEPPGDAVADRRAVLLVRALRTPDARARRPGAEGAMRIAGRVLDGGGEPCPTRWSRSGRRTPTAATTPASAGAARARTSTARTSSSRKPGRGPARRRRTSTVLVFARGLLKPLLTRLYFPDEVEANASDPVLAALPEARARDLVAAPGRTAASLRRPPPGRPADDVLRAVTLFAADLRSRRAARGGVRPGLARGDARGRARARERRGAAPA